MLNRLGGKAIVKASFCSLEHRPAAIIALATDGIEVLETMWISDLRYAIRCSGCLARIGIAVKFHAKLFPTGIHASPYLLKISRNSCHKQPISKTPLVSTVEC
jgi:hypothetical protein